MQRKTVLLLFGGESSEHEVSISSARNVYAAIDNKKFQTLLGYIDKTGRWWLLDELGDPVSFHGSPQLLPALGMQSFVTLPGNKIIRPDVILPILHGKNGEDGSVQGLAQLLHVPIVGCDVTSSAVCMDKLLAKEIVASHGITVVPYIIHRAYDKVPSFSKLQAELGETLFIKPNRAGSSVGVSKVTSKSELEAALQLAHRHDNIVLIEKCIDARELEVAVLGIPPDHQISGVGEIKPPPDDFYSYDAKYAAGSLSEVVVPADLDTKTSNLISDTAGRIYELLGCRGLARVDFFLGKRDKLYFNEVNTLPGFTNISMYPKLWRDRGLSYSALIEKLIETAE